MSAARSAAVGLKLASVTSVYGTSVRFVQLRLPTTATAASVVESFDMMCRIGAPFLVTRCGALVCSAIVMGGLEGDGDAGGEHARRGIPVAAVVPRRQPPSR